MLQQLSTTPDPNNSKIDTKGLYSFQLQAMSTAIIIIHDGLNVPSILTINTETQVPLQSHDSRIKSVPIPHRKLFLVSIVHHESCNTS